MRALVTSHRLRQISVYALGIGALVTLAACEAETPAENLPDSSTAPDRTTHPDGGIPRHDAASSILQDAASLPPDPDGGIPRHDAASSILQDAASLPPDPDGGIPRHDAASSIGRDAASLPPAVGCGRAGATGVRSFDTTVSGTSRRYQVVVPATYDSSLPMRLVFVFHGLGGSGNQIRSYLNLETIAAGQAIFVYPDGIVGPETYGRTGWANSDLAFFDAMVAEIASEYCIDAAQIFAMGHSFGAYMTDLVGCQRGDVVRAVAQISGGTQGGACRGPVPAWLSHGTRDTTVPVSAGQGARDHWRSINGCANTTTPTAIPDCVSYDGCAAPLTWCAWNGGHHPPFPAYTNQAIWDFFSTQ